MYEELLSECGLTKNESLAYLTLLRIGKSKSGEIVREAGISGGKIYETLYKLVDKGIVKYVNENGVKYFMANDPDSLILYVKERERKLIEKEKELEKVLPSLSGLKREDSSFESVFLIKGIRGISNVVYEVLEKGTSVKVMGVRSSKDERYNNFWMNWHRKRVEMKKEAKMLFSDKKTDYWKFFKGLKYTQVKEILHFSPSAIMIIDNHSFIFSYDKELICIHIVSEPIAKSFSNFFDDLWKIA
jgi:sugar-specific transcriptional regulator TrmB